MNELVLGKIIGLFRMKLDPQRGMFWRHLGDDVVNKVIHKKQELKTIGARRERRCSGTI